MKSLRDKLPHNSRHLKDNLISFQVWRPEQVTITVEGHPNECIEMAHLMCKKHFKKRWRFTEIKTQSPESRCKLLASQWLFIITARTS